MKVVLQRVSHAKVSVNGKTVSEIKKGLVILLGIAKQDTQENATYLINKILDLRIFPDKQDKMNLSIKDIEGEILVVSEFTLLGDCIKGRRPSFTDAKDAVSAEGMYNIFINKLKKIYPKVKTGVFRAMMDVELTNDGPVTFILDSVC